MLKFLKMNKIKKKKKVQVVVLAEHFLLLLEFKKNHRGFQNITGSVEENEDFFSAALREVKEETSIETRELIDLNFEHRFIDQWKNHCHEKVFLLLLNQRPAVVLSEEHSSYKWLPISYITEDDYTFPSNYEAFLTAKKRYQDKKL